jgi:DNA-binding NtrC family response regulator
MRVLIVDDEPLIRWALAEMLAGLECETVETGTAHDTRSAIKESAPFDTIFLDVRLPDCADLTLLRDVRALAPAARLIVMTAHGNPELAAQAFSIGAYAVIDKPFELSEVATLVRRHQW